MPTVDRGLRETLCCSKEIAGESPSIFSHVRLVHLGQKLPGVGRKGFHVTALALCIHNVKGQGGFSRARRPADHYQFVAGNVQADVFEIVLTAFSIWMQGLLSVFMGLYVSSPEALGKPVVPGAARRDQAGRCLNRGLQGASPVGSLFRQTGSTPEYVKPKYADRAPRQHDAWTNNAKDGIKIFTERCPA